MSTMLDWALHYRAQGLSIIPVSGKVPLIKWAKYQEEIASEEEIRDWYRQWPEADIGMVTGKISNRFVVDIDGEEGQRFISNYNLPPTVSVRTRRGCQLHYQFSAVFSGKTTLAGLAVELDTRGEGGYCKLPPSLFSDGSGRYEWRDSWREAAPCPQTVAELVEGANKPVEINREAGESWLSNILNGIKDGNRNASFTSIAGSLRSRGYNASDIYLFLADKAESVGFDLQELRTISESVGGYQPKSGVYTGVSEDEVIVPSQVLAQKAKINWIVDPKLISVNSLSFIVGLPKACKSWILMDLALALSTGTQWMGKFACKESKVLYLDQERSKESTIERFNRLIAGRGISPEQLDKNLVIRPQSRTKIDLPQSYAAFDRLLEKVQPDIVLVDSFKKFHSKNELSTQDMQVIFTRLDEIKDKYNCAVVFIHHETKSVYAKRQEHFEVSFLDAAGTIDLSQSADHFFNVLAYSEKDTSMMYHTANNHGNLLEPFKVSVVDVDNGIKVVGS